jgi:four helix bundle protein
MKDLMDNYIVHSKSQEFYENVFEDVYELKKDFRGKEISKQLIKSAGSICASIEEGYGRGYPQDFLRYLRISRGSARETKGWYIRSKRLLKAEILDARIKQIDEIIFLLIQMINTLESKKDKTKTK